MSYQLKYAAPAATLYKALQGDAFYIAMERSVAEASQEAMLRYYDFSMREAERYGKLDFLANPEHGASLWLKPLDDDAAREMAAAKKAFLLEHLGPSSLGIYNEMVGIMATHAASLVDDQAWYLSIIGLHPEAQGQGAGARLLTKVLETTDKLGVPTYLETFTPRTLKFYRRLGFEVEGSFEKTGPLAKYWLMVREAPQ